MAYPPGLTLHGKSWRITKKIPLDLSHHYGTKVHLRHQTGLSDKGEAAVVAWQWHSETMAQFERLRKTGSPHKTSIPAAEVTWLIDSMIAYSLGSHEAELSRGENSSLAPPSVTADSLSILSDVLASTYSDAGGMHLIADIADPWLEDHGYHLDKGSDEYRAVLLKFAQGIGQALKGWKSRMAGDWVGTPTPSKPAVAPPPLPSLLLSTVIKGFLDKADHTKPMFRKTAPALNLFLVVIGDKPVAELRQAAIDDFFGLLCKLPPRWPNEQRKRGCTVPELAAMDWPQSIAPMTFRDGYLAPIRPFLVDSRRLYGDQGFPLNLTADGIKYTGNQKAGTDKQRALIPAELERLFHGAESQSFAADPALSHCYWFPLLGLYTGARVNEVCQLNPEHDIRQEAGIWFLDITEDSAGDSRITKRLKNKTSSRRVPIHPRLIALGFLDYVDRIKASGATLLFPQWPPLRGRASGSAELWFRKHLAALGLYDTTPGACLKGYHCFRHTFISRATELGIQGFEAITGHTDQSTSAVVRGYAGTRSIGYLHAIVAATTYDTDTPI